MIPSPNPDVLTKYTWSTQGLQFYIHLKPSKEVMLRRHIWAITLYSREQLGIFYSQRVFIDISFEINLMIRDRHVQNHRFFKVSFPPYENDISRYF